MFMIANGLRMYSVRSCKNVDSPFMIKEIRMYNAQLITGVRLLS